MLIRNDRCDSLHACGCRPGDPGVAMDADPQQRLVRHVPFLVWLWWSFWVRWLANPYHMLTIGSYIMHIYIYTHISSSYSVTVTELLLEITSSYTPCLIISFQFEICSHCRKKEPIPSFWANPHNTVVGCLPLKHNRASTYCEEIPVWSILQISYFSQMESLIVPHFPRWNLYFHPLWIAISPGDILGDHRWYTEEYEDLRPRSLAAWWFDGARGKGGPSDGGDWGQNHREPMEMNRF